MKLFSRSTTAKCSVQRCKGHATHKVLTECSNGHIVWNEMCPEDTKIAVAGLMGCSDCLMLNLATVHLVGEL